MVLRAAKRTDIPRIVEMLADDELGRKRENLSDLSGYEAAFDMIEANSNDALYVWDIDGVAMGCLQLTFLPGMSYQGGVRGQVEGVRVDSSLRGQGIGAKMMHEAIAMSRARGCNGVQLSSNKSRLDAHRFYEKLGFEKSHEGMKLKL